MYWFSALSRTLSRQLPLSIMMHPNLQFALQSLALMMWVASSVREFFATNFQWTPLSRLHHLRFLGGSLCRSQSVETLHWRGTQWKSNEIFFGSRSPKSKWCNWIHAKTRFTREHLSGPEIRGYALWMKINWSAVHWKAIRPIEELPFINKQSEWRLLSRIKAMSARCNDFELALANFSLCVH